MLRFLVILLCLSLVLAACGGSERKAEELYQQGMTSFATADMDKAESIYKQILQEYPKTEAAKKAAHDLEIIDANKRLAIDNALLDVVQRAQQVLEGYRSMRGNYPKTRTELMAEDLFFDAPYLEEIVPEGATLTVLLWDDGSSYGFWAVHEGTESAFYLMSGKDSKVKKVTSGVAREHGNSATLLESAGRVNYRRG